MKAKYGDREILILPETDFEREAISSFRECTAFVKCGLTPAEVIGLLIRRKNKTNSEDSGTQPTASNKARQSASQICPFFGCLNPVAEGRRVCEQHLDIVF